MVDLHDSQCVVDEASGINIGGKRAIYRHAEHVLLLGDDHITILAAEIRKLLSKKHNHYFYSSSILLPFLSHDIM